MLTIFSIPKPFRGEAERLQMNAVQSWRASNPAARIVLCGDDEGVAEQAASLGVEHLGAVESSQFGTPMISSVFQKMIRRFPSDYYVYMNCDIILLEEVEPIIKLIPFVDFLGVVRRINMNVEETLDFRTDWYLNLKNRLTVSGVLEAERAIDFFLFRPNSIWEQMPAFVVGRPYWDNWMIFSARKNRLPVVDLTPELKIIHQNHGYTHIPSSYGRWWLGPEADHNRELAKAAGCVDQHDRVFTIFNATHIFTTNGMKKKVSYDVVRQKWHTAPLLYPRFSFVLDKSQGIVVWIWKHFRRVRQMFVK